MGTSIRTREQLEEHNDGIEIASFDLYICDINLLTPVADHLPVMPPESNGIKTYEREGWTLLSFFRRHGHDVFYRLT